VVLNGNGGNVINAGTAGGTLTNVDNVISGGGQLGAGQLTLVNQASGTINAASASALLVNTGTNAIGNAGVMEASASGGLNVNGAGGVTNTGTLWANGNALSVTGDVSGTGTDRITGAGRLHLGGTVAAGQTVSFDVGSTGTLQLAQSLQFGGTIVGLAASGANALDLADIGFISGTTKANFSGGTLTVTDGTHNAHIVLAGDYTGHTFVTSSDQSGGTKVVDPAEEQSLASIMGSLGMDISSFDMRVDLASTWFTSAAGLGTDWSFATPAWLPAAAGRAGGPNG
jgi:large repetitive protein